MQRFLQLPILQAVAILSLVHGLLCFTISGVPGLKETALFAASAVGTVFLSRTNSIIALFSWFKSYGSQFQIWTVCTLLMGLFILYRTMPRIDAAALEIISTATFFMFMVSIGNRFFK